MRAWWDGNVGVSESRDRRDGVVYGFFEDVTTTEVPNVVWGLPRMTTRSRGPFVSTGLTRTRVGALGWARWPWGEEASKLSPPLLCR